MSGTGMVLSAPVAPPARSTYRIGSVLTALTPVAVVVVAQVLLFPMPLGVWVQGVVLGLLGSMMAVGLGMVYRLNRVVNFAQGDLGSAPAVLAFGLIGLSGLNYFLGLATGLAGVVLLTVIAEVVVIRRFVRSPRLVLTVATIGLSQLLIVVSLLIPNIWGEQSLSSASVHFPGHLTFRLSPVVFTADDLVAVVVSVLALAALVLWFTRTDVGIAIRATGDRRDRAAMLGIPVNRLQTVTWVVAGVLSYLSVFLKAAIVGLPLDTTFSLTALASALGALALGGFTNLPLVALAAVAIGTLEQGVAWDQPARPTLFLAVIAAVVLFGMYFRQLVRAPGREGGRTGDDWLLISGIRDLPAAVRGLAEVRLAATGGTALLLAFMVTLPLWLGPGSLLEVSTLLALAVVGCSLVVLTGWAGQVSLGQMSFAAVGGVAAAAAVVDWHWDLSLAMLAAGGAGAVVAMLVGMPTLRLDGVFVAVTTLAFGLAVSGYLLDRAEFSWIPNAPLSSPRLFGVPITTQPAVYASCLGVVVVVVVAMYGLRRSRFGRVLRALSTNERAAAGYGVDIRRAKLGAFGVSGCIAGIAGSLLVLTNQQYLESPYTATASLAVFTATAVGGLGSVVGAVAGAAVIEGSAVFLPPSWQLFPSAFGVLIVLLAFPGGITSLIFGARDRLVGAVASRHGLAVGPGTQRPDLPPGAPEQNDPDPTPERAGAGPAAAEPAPTAGGAG